MALKRPKRCAQCREGKGFTLLELMLATALSAVVIGILSVCFAFALRVWGVVRDEKPDLTIQMMNLLQCQLAECEATKIKFTEGPHSLFVGQANAVVFVTSHSVKAISQGVSVVARYSWDPKSRMLSYSEVLLDPYHPQIIEDYLKTVGGEKSKVTSYGVEVPEFVLGYAGKDAKQFEDAWGAKDELPLEVLVKWKGQDAAGRARRFMVNAPLPVEAPTVQETGGTVINQ